MIYLLYDLTTVIYKDLASEANVSFAHTYRLHTKKSKYIYMLVALCFVLHPDQTRSSNSRQ